MALVLTRLVRSNYDELDNIPIIHQDLTASFTKQADTYYIHTGSTTSAYIKGRMYYCDGTNLKKVVIVDELPAAPNNGKLTITVNGTTHTFTANQAGNTSFSIQIPSQITSIDGLTGGTVNGNITLKKELVFADTTNPFIKMVTGGNTYYFQSAGGQFALGPTWDLATKWSADGSVQFPVRPKVGTADMALKSDISDTGATSIEVTGSGNAVTTASYSPSTRKLTLTKGTTFQEKLTAGTNITITDNIISAKDTTYTFTASNPTLAWNTKSKIGTIGGVEFNVTMPANPNTDTGATRVETSGDGNAVTTASYDASTRKLTLTKGTTFLTSHQSIKKLNTDNIATQTANASEAINGSGTINLHKVAKTGNYNDLLNKPSFDNLTRIQKQAYTGNDNTVQYFKLASFPVYNSGGNYASFIITGRMGGWQSDNMSFVNMILYNRNGEGGGYINVTNSAFFDLCDIVMYREEDGTSTAYLKVKSYYTFDINVNTYQATNAYTGTDDTPTGTLKWTASTQADRLAVSGGVAYVNGFTLPKQIKINGTTHNPDSNGLVDLGTTPIKSASLNSSTKTLTLALA